MDQIIDFFRRKPRRIACLLLIVAGSALALAAWDNILLRSLGLLLITITVRLLPAAARGDGAPPSPYNPATLKNARRLGVVGAAAITMLIGALVFLNVPEPYVTGAGLVGLLGLLAAAWEMGRRARSKG